MEVRMRGGKGVHLGLRVCVYLPPDCGKVPPTSHLESEGSGQLARDLGETQLAFSTALLPPEFMGVLSFKSVPQIYFCGIHTTTHYPHIHTHTPPLLSCAPLEPGVGGVTLLTLGQLRSVLPRSFQLSGCSVSSCYNAPRCCRQG